MVQDTGNNGNGNDEEIRIPGVPGGAAELQELFERHGVTDKGRELVLNALTAPPERRVGGGSNNVVTRFPSAKMGRVIQGESRTLEYAFVTQCEYDPAVRLYLCQPVKLFVRRRDARGHERGRWTVVDYLVVGDDGVALVECKTEAELVRKSSGDNPRFVLDGGRWRDPAAEEAAREFGFDYRVFSSAEVNGVWHRNAEWLAEWLGAADPDTELSQKIVSRLSKKGSMRVREAHELAFGKTEVVWWLMANHKVFADLERERIFEADTSWIHSTRSRMVAARDLQGPLPDVAVCHQVSAVHVEPGHRLLWNGSPYTVLNRSCQDVTLRPDREGGRSVLVPLADFEDFLRAGSIQGEGTEPADAVLRRREELLFCASEKDLAKANRRRQLLQEYRETGKVPEGSGLRSVKRYGQWAEQGLCLYGSEICGLIRFRGRRPGTSDMGDEQRQALHEVVKAYGSDIRAGRVAAAYARLTDLCAERGIVPAPSKGSLRLAAKRLSAPDIAREREGARAANRKSGPLKRRDNGIPAAADRVFQVAHVDHTIMDVQVFVDGSELGRPTFTVMEDDKSRLPLAAVLSFGQASAGTLSRLFADCVWRHHRLPETVVVDQGAEFNSVDFEFMLAALDIKKRERPAGKPRFGSIVESFFGTSNTRFLHELAGNTKLTRGRGLSRSHDPKRLAAWTFPGLHEIAMQWLFEVYPKLVHGTLGATPQEVFDRDLAYSGNRPSRYLSFDRSLSMILALRPSNGGTRRVSKTQGITVNYLKYWQEEFQHGDVDGSIVQVKINPMDCGSVFARVRKRWVTCTLVDGRADLAGRSWKQVELAVMQLAEKRRVGAKHLNINAGILGRFFRQVEGLGDQLKRQIMYEKAERSTLTPKPQEGKGPEPQSIPDDSSDSLADAITFDGTIGGAMPWLTSDDNDNDEEENSDE